MLGACGLSLKFVAFAYAFLLHSARCSDLEESSGHGFLEEDELLGNLVLRLGRPTTAKPQLEPHFGELVFSFMIPEGRVEQSSLAATLPFYGPLDWDAPVFEIVGDRDHYLEVGEVSFEKEEDSALYHVPINLRQGANVSLAHGPYVFFIMGVQNGMKDEAKLEVDIIPIDGTEFLTADVVEGGIHDDTARPSPKIKEINATANATSSIKVYVDGVVNGSVNVSEGLMRNQAIPHIWIRVATNSEEPVRLEVEPSDAFEPRPVYINANESARLVVIDPNVLDFEKTPALFPLRIHAHSPRKPQQKVSVELNVVKVDQSDQSPVFERNEYYFKIAEDTANGALIGEVVAVDPDSSQSLQYTLLGDGSTDFKLADGILQLRCQEPSKCLDFNQRRQYRLLALAVDEVGLSSNPASIVVDVSDVNDHGPILELLEPEMLIFNGRLRRPYIFIVHDADGPENREHRAELGGYLAKSFRLDRLTRSMYSVQPIGELPRGKHALQMTLTDAQDHNLKQVIKIPVKVVGQPAGLVNYTVSINLSNVKVGDVVTSLGRSTDVIYLFASEKPVWLSLNAETGQAYVSQVPEQNDLSTEVKVISVDRLSGQVVSKVTIKLIARKSKAKQTAKDQTSVSPWNGKVNPRSVITQVIGFGSEGPFELDPNVIKVGYDGSVKSSQSYYQRFGMLQITSVVKGQDEVLSLLTNASPQSVLSSKPTFVGPSAEDLRKVIPVDGAKPGAIIGCFPCLSGNRLLEGGYRVVDGDEFVTVDDNGCLRLKEYDEGRLDVRIECGNEEDRDLLSLKLQLSGRRNDNPFEPFTTDPIQISESIDTKQTVTQLNVIGSGQLKTLRLIDYSNKFEATQQPDNTILIRTAKSAMFDRETKADYSMFVVMQDNNTRTSVTPLSVTLLDENDNSPQFADFPLTVNVCDKWGPGMPLAVITAEDPDSGANGRVVYEMDPSASDSVQLDAKTGILQLKRKLRTSATGLDIWLTARDMGNPARETRTRLRLQSANLKDGDERKLVIQEPSSGFDLVLPDETQPGTVLFTAEAKYIPATRDSPKVKFNLEASSSSASDVLEIDENSGEVTLAKSLGQHAQHTFRLVARDPDQAGEQASKLLVLRRPQPQFEETSQGRAQRVVLVDRPGVVHQYPQGHSNQTIRMSPECRLNGIKLDEATGQVVVEQVPTQATTCVLSSKWSGFADEMTLSNTQDLVLEVKPAITRPLVLRREWDGQEIELEPEIGSAKWLDGTTELAEVQLDPTALTLDLAPGPDGVYSLNLTGERAGLQLLQQVMVFQLGNDQKLGLVSELSPDQFSLELARFSAELATAIQAEIGTEVHVSVERPDAKNTSTGDRIWSQEKSLALLKPGPNTHQTIRHVYQSYHVNDVKECELSSSVSDTESQSKNK